jgi:hypothetical protein
MSPLTVFLAKLFGVSGILLFAAFTARPKASVAALQSIVVSPGLILITGIFTMAAGVAMVIGHDVWTGGALAIVVTALGWITLLKGFAVTALPPAALGALYRLIGYPRRFRLIMGVALILSLWLTYAAFTAQPVLVT